MPRHQGNKVAAAAELGDGFDLAAALRVRLLPLVVIAEAPGIGYGNADCRIHFWCTRGRSEVDFVLYGADGFHAIQVNNGRSLRPADLRGIETFHRDYPETALLLLYRGSETLERDGVRCMPVDRFLRELVPGRDLPR